MQPSASNKKSTSGSMNRLAIFVVVLAIAAWYLHPATIYNGIIGFPAWVLFSVAYVLEWDDNDSPLIKWRNEVAYFYLDHAIIPPPPPVTVIDYATANMTVEDILRKHSNNYYHPVIIKGVLKNVPAITKWASPDYFSDCCGDDEYLALIDGRVMAMNRTGAKLNEVYRQEVMNLRDLIDGIKKGKKYYINNLSDIFRKHNHVLDDLQLPTSIGPWWGPNHALYRPVMAQLFMGVGDKNITETTGSAWHCARHANLFVQVVGNKTWSFMDPKYSLLTCPHLRHHVVAAAADRNGWRFEYKWPIRQATIEPGDLLFNPPWQWHMITNSAGFNIGVATREVMNIQNFYNNFMFTALQEFSEAKTSFFDYKRPVTRFLSKIPFFFTTIACVKEAIYGYTAPPTDAWTNACDEHSPVCVKGVTDLQKSAANRGN